MIRVPVWVTTVSGAVSEIAKTEKSVTMRNSDQILNPGGIPGGPGEPLGPGDAAGDLRRGAFEAAQAVLAGSLKGGRHDRLLVTPAGHLGAAARAPCLISGPRTC